LTLTFGSGVVRAWDKLRLHGVGTKKNLAAILQATIPGNKSSLYWFSASSAT